MKVSRARHGDGFGELKQLVKQAGLIDKRRLHYCCRMFANFSLLGFAIVLLASLESLGWQLLNAVFLAIVFTQLGFIVHDAGHHQVFEGRWKNDWLGIFHADLVLGFSYARWIHTHNQHHRHPNLMGTDPDTDYPVFALSEAQALGRRGVWRWTARHQAILFFPILTLEAVSLKVDCIRFLCRKKVGHRAGEFACLFVHFILYFGTIFYFLDATVALLFILVHQAVFGLYLSSVIVPNHIGMPTRVDDSHTDFMNRQVRSSRNLRRHLITDYIYGPLACQIEHHLFPTMPLGSLRKAQEIVRPFCEKRGMPYHETSPLQSYREILKHLYRVSAPLRNEVKGSRRGKKRVRADRPPSSGAT